jgi:primosomal protein N' (replication factor Y)
VAAPRLFRLRAEVAVAPSGPIAERLPIARVRVDTGVFHLDQLYDYSVPEKLSEVITSGVRVQIPFGNRETEGIVVARVASPERGGTLKAITKVLSPHCVATPASLALIDKAAEFYCCNPWDLLRSAIPPRVASVDKELSVVDTSAQSRNGNKVRAYQSFRPFIASDQQIPEIVQGFIKSGSVLIVAPDEKDVDRLVSSLSSKYENVLRLSSSSTREERYRNFLLAMRLQSSIVVGTRSSVFTPVNNLTAIIIYKESSPDHFDLRSPGWNSSTIARMRSELEGIGLVFTGFTPSVRVAYDIDRSTIKFNNQRTQINVQAFSPSDGTLLPGRIYSEIKKALKKGPVLFVAPRKGYGNALLCAHCRNVALCKCGGRLSVSSKGLAPTCVHCGTGFPQWKCTFCDRDKQYLAGRGIERAAEEISRAFPGFPVVISAGDVIKDSVDSRPALVLSTPGAQPAAEGGYAAVVVLDAIRFFSHTDINGQERARELLFETASLVSSDGQVLLVLDDSHPVVAALARWNIAPLLKRELAEREELKLPPSVVSAVLVMEQTSASAILSGLKKALEDGRLPSSTRIFGATMLPKGQAKIVMHVSHEQNSALGAILHELQRKRSISKKDLFTLRIDPYSL